MNTTNIFTQDIEARLKNVVQKINESTDLTKSASDLIGLCKKIYETNNEKVKGELFAYLDEQSTKIEIRFQETYALIEGLNKITLTENVNEFVSS